MVSIYKHNFYIQWAAHPHSDEMEAMLLAAKKLPEWARESLLGKIELDRAWKTRGAGYADTVTEEAWRSVGEHLAKARGHLVAAWMMRPDQPYAADEMISVVMMVGPEEGESLRLWFDRAVTARFDEAKAYNSYAWALRPRWDGSHEEMLAFGRACAATKRFDTKVPERLIKLVDDVGNELSKRREIYLLPSIIDDVIAVGKGYIAASDRPFDLNRCLSNQVIDAWLCHRYADGREALKQLPDQKLDPSMRNRLTYFSVGRNNVVGETIIDGTPAKDDYFQARKLVSQERWAEAAPHYAAALKTVGDQPTARELITFMSRLNETNLTLKSGQWLDFSPKAAEHDDWTLSKYGQWTVPADGMLEVIGAGETTMSRWHGPTGENFEMRATFEFLSAPEVPPSLLIELGDVAGARTNNSVGCQFYSDKEGHGKVWILHSFYDAHNPVYEVKMEAKNRVQISCWQNRLTMVFNGKTVFENLLPNEGIAGDKFGQIGFGNFKMTPKLSFRVTEMSVRQLKEEPRSGEDASK